MFRYLLDTDHLTLFEHVHVPVWRRFLQHPPGTVGISAVTVEEYLSGRLAALARHQAGPRQVQAYSHFIASLALFQQFAIAGFDLGCDARYQQLRRLRLRVGSQDLRIAATALMNQVTLVTRNRRDFAGVPGLSLDDWSV
jgi:tRNA(fMet)-specific endonuclease VapC